MGCRPGDPEGIGARLAEDEVGDCGEFAADLFVDNRLIVELKAARNVADEHVAQLLGYLRSSRIETGLLINFGTSIMSVKKYLMSDPQP